LSCNSCMTTCAAKVDYLHLADIGRAYIEAHYRRPLADRLTRWLVAATGPNPDRLRQATRLARLPRPLRRPLPPRPRPTAPLPPAARRPADALAGRGDGPEPGPLPASDPARAPRAAVPAHTAAAPAHHGRARARAPAAEGGGDGARSLSGGGTAPHARGAPRGL